MKQNQEEKMRGESKKNKKNKRVKRKRKREITLPVNFSMQKWVNIYPETFRFAIFCVKVVMMYAVNAPL